MGMNPTQRLLAVATARTPGLRTIRRPESATSPVFDLAYTRTGPRTSSPTVIIPGGPGLGSVLPYRGMRRWATRGGLDLIMVEHRGVGLSRTDAAGEDLPFSAMWIGEVIDDVAAVLNREGVRSAFIAGSSYGSYVASGFGVRHGERVAGMLLDSALQSTADLGIERKQIRQLFWEGDGSIATIVRRLVESGENERNLLDIVRAAFELGGTELVLPLLHQRIRQRGGLVWGALGAYATRGNSIVRIPGIYDFDIAGAIGFRELGYGASADGLPLDPALTYAPSADRFPRFEGEPFDLPSQTPEFTWPMVLLSGRRDLRTPPQIARRAAESAQNAVLVHLENGHSALDTHPAAMLNAIRGLVSNQHDSLPAMEPQLDRLPRRGIAARFPTYLTSALRFERLLTR